ncbi:MAG: PP2C family protein-serine/threonine phosphatase [Methanobrevibacter sp.]|jgi:sigma-B regulation protein RsbU (phosphoserine phosphatase)|nr:PP2C family protein-serine/threonine phosphatase [Candidatus Methanovirga procula]
MNDKLKSNLKRFLISLIVYAITFTFFDSTMYFSNKIDPSIIFISFFPLIWGLWGILGLFAGDLIGRVLSIYFSHGKTFSIPETIVFSLCVLMISYFIYKLYYSFDIDKKVSTIHFYEPYNLIKFIIILCITNALYVFIHIYFTIAFSGMSFQDSLIEEFSNNFIFVTNLSLIFSLFFVSIAGLTNVKIYTPKKTKNRLLQKYLEPFSEYLKPYSRYLVQYSRFINIMILIYTIVLIYQVKLCFDGNHSVHDTTMILFALLFINILVVIKPITKDVVVKKNRSFSEFVIFIFIFLSMISVIFSLFSFSLPSYHIWIFKAESGFNEAINILYFFLSNEITLIQILFTFFCSMFVMHRLEVIFTKPLHSISDITESYVLNKFNSENETLESNERLNENIESILNRLDVLSHNKYDLGPLAQSFKEMIENLEIFIEDLKRLTSEKERIIAEMDIASKIQKDILPNIFPPFPDRLNEFDIFAMSIPAKNVGGDFYDYFLVDNDHLAIVIGDVSGKGVPAAIFMSIAQTLIKEQSSFGLSPSKVFNNVNKRIIENNDHNLMFITSWFGVLELSSGKLNYVNAGHDPPFISRNYSNYTVLTSEPHLVLGVVEDITYTQYETTISEGDRLYLYTDGIIEGINKKNEQFSKNRLLDILNNNKTNNIKELILEIKRDLNEFTHGMEQFDDETMVILEYKNKNVD